MSTDAGHKHDSTVNETKTQPQIAESAGVSSDAVEVLIRLPDLRKQHSGAESTSSRAPNKDKGSLADSDSNSSSFLGPIFDTLRHRWSTWKNAAMFAQAGVLTRTLVVGGLMLGMVIAAYVLMNSKDEPAESAGDAQNTAQHPAPPSPPQHEIQLAAPVQNSNQIDVNSAGNETSQNWAAVRLDDAATPRMPKTGRQMETESRNRNPVQHAVEINQQPSQQRQVYSADTRNRADAVRSSDASNSYRERGATRNAQRPNYNRYDNSATRGYQDTNQRFNSSDRSSRDPYPGSRQDYRYTPSNNSSNPPPRAGFRGTIEPAPYRSR